MPHFEKHMLPEYDVRLPRGPIYQQVLKICYVCRKGFCKRKGQAKALEVANAPGRWVCLKFARAHPEQTDCRFVTVIEHCLIKDFKPESAGI